MAATRISPFPTTTAVATQLANDPAAVTGLTNAIVTAYPFLGTGNPSGSGAITFVAGGASSGSITSFVTRNGDLYQITLLLGAYRVPITDGTTSGSYGSNVLLT